MESEEKDVVKGMEELDTSVHQEPKKKTSHVLVLAALFLTILGIVVSAYVFFIRSDFIAVTEPQDVSIEQQATSTPAITYSDGEIHFLDIQGEVISIIPKDTPYYDFTPVLGTDFMLPFKAPPASGDFLFDEQENYVFRLDQDWRVATTDIEVPRLYENPRYTLVNKDATCYITYLDSPKEGSIQNGYIQSMYGYGFASVYEQQFSTLRLIDTQGRSGGERDMAVSPWRPYEKNEISFSSRVGGFKSDRDSGLVLYAHKSATVSKACDEQFVGMLRTFEPQYMPVSISKVRDGTIEFIAEYGQEGSVLSFTQSPLRFVRVIWNGNDGIKKQLKKFNTLFSEEKVTVYKNIFYYIKEDVGLVSYNLFTDTETVVIKNSVNKDANKDRVVGVNEFFMYKNTLYTLQGEWCNDYMSKCTLKLFESNLDGANSILLAEGITDRDIIGFDAQTQSLYLRFAEGDAGCVWGTYHTYNLQTKKVTLLQEVSGCYSENEEKPAGVIYMEQLEAQFTLQVQQVYQIQLVNETFFPVTTKNEVSGRNIPIRYINNL